MSDDAVSSSNLWEEARRLGQIEGRAEAADEISVLYSQIAEMHQKLAYQTEEKVLSSEDFKVLLSKLYKRFKAAFQDDPEKETICSKIKLVMRNVSVEYLSESECNERPEPEVNVRKPKEENRSEEEIISVDSEKFSSNTFIAIESTEKKGQGRSMYISYMITNALTAESLIVARRFRDFSWLYKRLLCSFPNAAIPLLPPRVCNTNINV